MKIKIKRTGERVTLKEAYKRFKKGAEEVNHVLQNEDYPKIFAVCNIAYNWLHDH